MEQIGYMSGILLALCGVPLAISAVRKKRADIDSSFLAVWFIGEILGLVYVIYLAKGSLILNYGANTLLLLVVIYYKIKGNRNKEP